MAIPCGRGVLSAAGAAAALCAWTAPAAALDVRREITFVGGGLLGLRCAATPDVDAITVTAETKLHVRNATGYSATLLTNDEPIGEVAADAVAELLLHRGPVELTLKPHCVTSRYGSVRVQVVGPPVTAPPAPTAAPGSPRPTPAATPAPTSPPVTATPAARATATASSAAVDPRAGHAGLGPGGPGGPVDVPVLAEALAADGRPVAEPVASVRPMTDRGTVTLLGLIAFICIAGVSTAAIRAIVAQRTFRAVRP